jgi:predicted AlkP superfamily phosphohydrolase/phosphomutase
VSRVLVIGLQEITHDLLQPWVRQGFLPNIASLIDKGSVGRVNARAPLITPHGWANILTGVQAGPHGIFDYWQRDADGVFRESTSENLRVPAIWDHLHNTGLRCTFLNVPLTDPPPDLDGLVAAAAKSGSPSREHFSPRDTYDRIAAAGIAYRPEATAPGGRKKEDYIGLFDIETPKTAQAFEFLLESRPWNFALVYFVDAAMAQHYFWSDMREGDNNPYCDVVLSAYRNLDAAIGRLADSAGPNTNIFLLSECGAGPIRSGVNLNAWLERHGLLFAQRRLTTGVKQAIEDHLLPVAKRVLPPSVKTALTRRSVKLKNWASSSGTHLDLDWSRTRVFSRGKEGNIFVNLAGRDPHGIVNPDSEYGALLDEIETLLLALRDPVSGEPVVGSVSRPTQIYSGPAVGLAPDLIVDWTNGQYMMTEKNGPGGDVFVERRRKGMSWPTTGSHRHEGVVVASGPGISRNSQMIDTTQFDLLPTWLSMLGQPIPQEFEGRVLSELLD